MTAPAPCQAYVLGEVIAVLDGAVSETGGMTCDEPPSSSAHIRRPGWNFVVEVCEPHRVVISLSVVGFIRST
jgi:hypothetical protein